jgi:hypothetical protein
MVETYRVSRPSALFISWYTRCGLIGTSGKSVRRSIVRFRSTHSSTHAVRLGTVPAAFRSRATSTSRSRADRASETIAKSGGKIRPICVASMSTCTNVRPRV